LFTYVMNKMDFEQITHHPGALHCRQ